MSDLSPVGTIAFVKDEERLFARVSDGWKPLQVKYSNLLNVITKFHFLQCSYLDFKDGRANPSPSGHGSRRDDFRIPSILPAPLRSLQLSQ
jgi:hypothetical protein